PLGLEPVEAGLLQLDEIGNLENVRNLRERIPFALRARLGPLLDRECTGRHREGRGHDSRSAVAVGRDLEGRDGALRSSSSSPRRARDSLRGIFLGGLLSCRLRHYSLSLAMNRINKCSFSCLLGTPKRRNTGSVVGGVSPFSLGWLSC